MDHITFLKNFPMGTEIDIAGTFIYNGMREFTHLQNFCNENEIFYFLYMISSGVERLQKVLIVLLEDINISNCDAFFDSLITHSHQDLHNRIKQRTNLQFSSVQNQFLQLLSNFYKTCRYGRYQLTTNYAKERDLLITFITTNLHIEITVDNLFENTQNDNRIKKFIGRVIGTISRKYYCALMEECRKLNLYTYELRNDSCAQKIFLSDFHNGELHRQYLDEEIAMKELLIFLINNKESSGFIDFIKAIEPLDLEIALMQEYIGDLGSGTISQSLIDEIDSLYIDGDFNAAERIKLLNLIGNTNVCFDLEEDEEIDELEQGDFQSELEQSD